MLSFCCWLIRWKLFRCVFSVPADSREALLLAVDSCFSGIADDCQKIFNSDADVAIDEKLKKN